MADTLGGLIDKLLTVDLKMWNNQETLYQIRKMTFDEYKTKYFDTEDGAKILWEQLKKATDLNFQRNQLIDEIDDLIVTMIEKGADKESLEPFIQRKHKTY